MEKLGSELQRLVLQISLWDVRDQQEDQLGQKFLKSHRVKININSAMPWQTRCVECRETSSSINIFSASKEKRENSNMNCLILGGCTIKDVTGPPIASSQLSNGLGRMRCQALTKQVDLDICLRPRDKTNDEHIFGLVHQILREN